MAELKTKLTDASAVDYVASLGSDDAQTLLAMFGEITGEEPRMWGDAMVGYGVRTLTYSTGKKIDWFAVGFSQRKSYFSLYLCVYGIEKDAQLAELVSKLGKCKVGCGCVNVRKLADIDMTILRDIIEYSYKSNN